MDKQDEVKYPENGEKVYFIKSNGKIYSFHWEKTQFNKELFHWGNIFLREDEAQVAATVLGTYLKMHQKKVNFN